MAMYGKMEYWDERYKHSESYDWLQNYNSLRRLLTVEALMATTKLNCMLPFPSHEKCRVLILGCGNSTFGHDMLADGWQGHITNVDFSSVVIDQMKKKYQKYSESMDFVCADITKGLPFEDKSFDLIICKGTFDAILTSAGSVSHAKVVVSECSRVLANGHGVLFLVSHGNHDSRAVFLERDNDLSYYWQEVSVHTVARRSNRNAKNDYVYICRKRLEDVPVYRKTHLSASQPADNNSKVKELPQRLLQSSDANGNDAMEM